MKQDHPDTEMKDDTVEQPTDQKMESDILQSNSEEAEAENHVPKIDNEAQTSQAWPEAIAIPETNSLERNADSDLSLK